MSKSTLVLALIATLPLFAQAEEAKPAEPTSPHTFTSNLTVASQYIYRGLSQTDGKPAIQGGFDYSHASGVYVGTWLSNVSWYGDQTTSGTTNVAGAGTGNSSSIEMDVYAGYKYAINDDANVDIGVLQYYYPGHYDTAASGYAKPNTTEVYVAGTYKWATVKYSHALSPNTFGVPDSKNAHYIDLTINAPIGESGYTVISHAGRQQFITTNNANFSYNDYKLGLTKDLTGDKDKPGYIAGVAYTYATSKDVGYKNFYGKNTGNGRVTASVNKTF